MKSQPGYADLIAQARIADTMSDWQQSCRLYVDAADLAQSGPRRAYALNNAAISCRQMGEIDRALRYLIQASLVLGGEGDVPTRAEIELTIGNTLVDAGVVSDAIPHLEAAIRLFRQSERNEEALNAEIGLGRALAHQGRYEDAERIFSLAIAKCHTDELLSQGLNNLAIVRWRHGRLDEAAALLERDVQLCEAGGDQRGQAVALTNLGRLKAHLGNRAEAISHFKVAAVLFRAVGAVADAEGVERDSLDLRGD